MENSQFSDRMCPMSCRGFHGGFLGMRNKVEKGNTDIDIQ